MSDKYVGGFNPPPAEISLDTINERLGTDQPIGTSVTYDVMKSKTDITTPNALLRRGDFGLGTVFKASDVVFNGSVIIGRSNGIEAPITLDIQMQKKFNQDVANMVITIKDGYEVTQDYSGIRGVHFNDMQVLIVLFQYLLRTLYKQWVVGISIFNRF